LRTFMTLSSWAGFLKARGTYSGHSALSITGLP
jgi:hypothetical protein